MTNGEHIARFVCVRERSAGGEPSASQAGSIEARDLLAASLALRQWTCAPLGTVCTSRPARRRYRRSWPAARHTTGTDRRELCGDRCRSVRAVDAKAQEALHEADTDLCGTATVACLPARRSENYERDPRRICQAVVAPVGDAKYGLVTIRLAGEVLKRPYHGAQTAIPLSWRFHENHSAADELMKLSHDFVECQRACAARIVVGH